MADDTTFVTRMAPGSGDGPRLAVKDLIDVAGVPTTAACRALADREPAAADAPLMAGARRAGARVVGKTNLHELALGASGVNRAFGTPRNPLDPELVPGGSSSGSAVAVATGEADVAYGTDTGGSVRVPSACCGTAGLKTTLGRVSIQGVWPVAPSLDTVGPMARDVAGLVLGMQLLEPGFEPVEWQPARVGWVELEADPEIVEAGRRALAAAGWEVVPAEVGDWAGAGWEAVGLLSAESWASDGAVVEARRALVGDDVAERVLAGRTLTDEDLARAHGAQRRWRSRLEGAFERVELLALPTLPSWPGRVDEEEDVTVVRSTLPVNVAGNPALALPVPSGRRLPASVQLVGPWGAEDRLLSAGATLEAAVG